MELSFYFFFVEEVLQGVAAGVDLFESTYVAYSKMIVLVSLMSSCLKN